MRLLRVSAISTTLRWTLGRKGELMLKTLTLTCALCLVAGLLPAQAQQAAAQAQPTTVKGCNYNGLEGCRLLRTTSGKIYSLVAISGIPLPPPNLIVTATGTVRPPGLICGPNEIFEAASIKATKMRCKGPPGK